MQIKSALLLQGAMLLSSMHLVIASPLMINEPVQKAKRQLSTTPAAPSTTRAISTTPAAPSTTRAISTTPAAPSTTPKLISTTPAAPSTTPKITTTTKSTTAAQCTATTTTISGRKCQTYCNMDRAGNNLPGNEGLKQTGNFADCQKACANDPNCATAQYVESSGFCYLKGYRSPLSSNPGVDTVDCDPNPEKCDPNYTYTANGLTCSVQCNVDYQGGNEPGKNSAGFGPVSFTDCVKSCNADSNCLLANYNEANSFCYPKSKETTPNASQGIDTIFCRVQPYCEQV